MSIRTLAVLAIGFVAGSAASSHAATAKTPSILAEHVRGKVILTFPKAKSGRAITSELSLKPGSILTTDPQATVEIHATGYVVELAPASRVQIQSSRSLVLQSGQVRFTVLPGQHSALLVPGLNLSLAGNGGARILAAATQSEKQFAERLQSQFSPEAAMQVARGFAEMITVSGEFWIRGRGGRQLRLAPGDWIKVSKAGAPFAPSRTGLDEIHATERSLGFATKP